MWLSNNIHFNISHHLKQYWFLPKSTFILFTVFDPKQVYLSDKPGLEIFLGFAQDRTEPVSGKIPILATSIIIHEKYIQENGMVTNI